MPRRRMRSFFSWSWLSVMMRCGFGVVDRGWHTVRRADTGLLPSAGAPRRGKRRPVGLPVSKRVADEPDARVQETAKQSALAAGSRRRGRIAHAWARELVAGRAWRARSP